MFIIAIHLIIIFHLLIIIMSCHQFCHFSVMLSVFFLFDYAIFKSINKSVL